MASDLKRYRVVVKLDGLDHIVEDIFARNTRSAEAQARKALGAPTGAVATATKMLDKLPKVNGRARRPVSFHDLVQDSPKLAPPARIVSMTPEMALQILEQHDPNRHVTQSRVERYAKDMRAGRWTMNGETIKFGRSGELLDGQHRLWAVIESGCTIDFLLVEGLDPEVMATIDTGKARTFGDVLSIQRQGKNSMIVASTARLLFWYENGCQGVLDGAHPTHSQLADVVARYPDIHDAAHWVSGHSRAKKLMPPAPLGLSVLVTHRISPEKSEEWLSLLDSGAGLEVDHPVYLLRDRLLKRGKGKRQNADLLALAVRSWNNFLIGKRTNFLMTWREGDPFPLFNGLNGKPFKVES